MAGSLSFDNNRISQALLRLRRRGPDIMREHQNRDIKIWNSILHITGKSDYYHSKHRDFIAYNGEIYDYQDHGTYLSDIELVHDAVTRDLDLLRKSWGAWAWCADIDGHLLYATDPQGERCLYHRRDQQGLIVASEPALILDLQDCERQMVPYNNKTWTMIEHTPWQGIQRVRPGWLYRDGEPVCEIDSIWRWIQPDYKITDQEAQEEFHHQFGEVMRRLCPSRPHVISYSGGIDSSIIMQHLPEARLLAVNNQGKDPIVDRIQDFIGDRPCRVIDVDAETWAGDFRDLISATQMPAQSWSHVGRWIVAREADAPVIICGDGADELFGGYTAYQGLEFKTNNSVSPYSQDCDPDLWRQCLEAYHGDAAQAQLLADYWHQVVGCDAPGQDRIYGHWSRESRTPFLARPIMQFALNLPLHLKLGLGGKPLLRQEFTRHWSADLMLPKKGFTGHANDALPWLDVSIQATGYRDYDWKSISRESFHAYTKK
jgi:asparagine synthetase B (glutamine-hydrolysing)